MRRRRASIPGIGLLTISGTLTDSSVMTLFHQLRQLAAGGRPVAALVARLSSPGGSLAAAQAIVEQLQQLRDETGACVVTVVDDSAASAAFYVALHGDRVVAQPAAVLGLVGAQLPRYDVSALMQRLGVHDVSVSSTLHKRSYDRVLTQAPSAGASAPALHALEQPEPSSAAHRADLAHELVEDVHEQFLHAIRTRRPQARPDAALLDGRLFTGRVAHGAGLIDELGGTTAALAHATQRCGLPDTELLMLEPAPAFDPVGMLLSSVPFGRQLGRLLGKSA